MDKDAPAVYWWLGVLPKQNYALGLNGGHHTPMISAIPTLLFEEDQSRTWKFH